MFHNWIDQYNVSKILNLMIHKWRPNIFKMSMIFFYLYLRLEGIFGYVPFFGISISNISHIFYFKMLILFIKNHFQKINCQPNHTIMSHFILISKKKSHLKISIK